MSKEKRLDVDKVLLKTLSELGVSDVALRAPRWRVVSSAHRDDAEMSRTYHTLNTDLLQTVAEKPIAIRHITGEARVLVDPAHRNVIAKNRARGAVAKIACRQPEENAIHDSFSFITAQRHRWKQISWMDLIDIVSLASEGAMRIYVLNRPAAVHYSIFGRDRVLLQEQHVHPSERKRVWYIESRDLVDELADLTIRYFSSAKPIPPASFEAMRRWLFSASMYPILGARLVSVETCDRLSDFDRHMLTALGLAMPTGDENYPLRVQLPWEPPYDRGTSSETTSGR